MRPLSPNADTEPTPAGMSIVVYDLFFKLLVLLDLIALGLIHSSLSKDQSVFAMIAKRGREKAQEMIARQRSTMNGKNHTCLQQQQIGKCNNSIRSCYLPCETLSFPNAMPHSSTPYPCHNDSFTRHPHPPRR